MARHKLAVILLAAVAITSPAWVLLDVVTAFSQRSATFGVASFESRFDGLRAAVKPHTTYGYVSDNPASDPFSQAEYYLTQYTLVPAIVKASTEEPLEVGNMHNQQQNEDQIKAQLAARHLVKVQEFGSGVFLYRNNYAK